MLMLCAEQRLEALGTYGVNEANKMADNMNSLSTILHSIHNYIKASTDILPVAPPKIEAS